MHTALAAARCAAAAGEVPVGAVVVLGERVVGTGRNSPVGLSDPTAHAEVVALRAAAACVGNYRLVGATLIVTVEPCIMCVGASVQARVTRLVYGCRDPKAGALGSVYDVGRDGRLNHRIEVIGGVCEDEARELLQTFFRLRRGA